LTGFYSGVSEKASWGVFIDRFVYVSEGVGSDSSSGGGDGGGVVAAEDAGVTSISSG
jgi:hypothetical protein